MVDMTSEENQKQYMSIMNESFKNSSKGNIPKDVKGQRILDVGSGGGVMLDALEEMYGGSKEVFGTDIRPDVIRDLSKKAEQQKAHWSVQLHNFATDKLAYKVDTIIFSSILHEIFSFTPIDGKLFNLESVVRALNNAYDSLNPGGRIIIRDGVKVQPKGDQAYTSLCVKDAATMDMWDDFIGKYKGLQEVPRSHSHKLTCDEGTWLLNAPTPLIHEFMFKATWGWESYAREVNEQFGYLSLQGYEDLLHGLGFKVKASKQFFEPGYAPYFDKLFATWPEFPTTLYIVADKE